MTGPQQERLRQNVDGADHGQVTSAGFDWKSKGDLLDIVARQLEFNATAPREAMGGQTGVATSEAFARSGKAMAAKSAELQRGGEILMKSGQALKNAEDEHRSLGAQPGAPTEPTYDSGSPQTKAELRQHSEHQAAAAAWQAEYDRREKRAEKANQELEQALRGYSNDMAEIHGENMDKPSSVQGGSGSVAAPGSGGTAYASGGGGGHAAGGGRGDQSHAQGEFVEYVPGHHGTTTPPSTTVPPPSGGDVGAGTGTGTIGAPAASAQGGTPVLGQTAATGATGSSVSPASSATGSAIGAGGLAVAAGGGLMAAGASPASAIRGGLVASPTAAAGGASARSIGAGAARGAASTLGRPGSVVAGNSPTTSASARSAGGGATGRGTTSRAGVAGQAGSQAGSQAGARGAGGSGRTATGAAAPGAAARGGGKDKRRNAQVVDHLLEEWEVDEEDLGPAVID